MPNHVTHINSPLSIEKNVLKTYNDKRQIDKRGKNMYNLNRFNPREELVVFENSAFVFDKSEQYSLSEEQEKIWSYNVTEEEETLPVIFQLMWFENKIHISYSTEHASEGLRVKVSEMVHRIQDALRQKTKAPIILEQPIISDLRIYENNCADYHNVRVHAEIIKSRLTQVPVVENEEYIFELYGKDGFMLGESLQEIDAIEFRQQEGIMHQLVIKRALSKEQRVEVLELIQFLGYAISYEEIETYTKESVIDLFSSGLIQIEQA